LRTRNVFVDEGHDDLPDIVLMTHRPNTWATFIVILEDKELQFRGQAVPVLGLYVLQVQFWHVEHYGSRVVSWSRRWEVAVEDLRGGK
jgi:hypothetical protein